MLHNVNDAQGKRRCDSCNDIVDNWIDIVPLFSICIPCAQMTMRRLFEDLIQFHNGKHISLLKIMHHGECKKDSKPQSKSLVELFNF